MNRVEMVQGLLELAPSALAVIESLEARDPGMGDAYRVFAAGMSAGTTLQPATEEEWFLRAVMIHAIQRLAQAAGVTQDDNDRMRAAFKRDIALLEAAENAEAAQ